MGSARRIEFDERVIVLLLIVVVGLTAFAIGQHIQPSATSIHLVISPGAEGVMLELIQGADESIDVEMYLFTERKLASALADAQSRGVVVRVITERTMVGGSIDDVLSILTFNGVQARFSSPNFRLTHSKFAVFDRKIVLIGSHNWSFSAMNKNREVSVVVSNPLLAAQLTALFESDWTAAEDV